MISERKYVGVPFPGPLLYLPISRTMKKLIIPAILAILVFSACSLDLNRGEAPSVGEVQASLDSVLLKLEESASNEAKDEKVIYDSNSLGIYDPFIAFPSSSSSAMIAGLSIPEEEEIEIQLGPNTFYREKAWYSDGGKTYVAKGVLLFSSIFDYPLVLDGVEYDYSYQASDEEYLIASASFDRESGTEWINGSSSRRVSVTIGDTTNPVKCTFAPSVLDTDVVAFISVEDGKVSRMGVLSPLSGEIAIYPLPYEPTGYDPARSVTKTYSCAFFGPDAEEKGRAEFTFEVEYTREPSESDETVLPEIPSTISIDLYEFHQALASYVGEGSASGEVSTNDLEAALSFDVYADFGTPSRSVDEITILEETFHSGDEIEVLLGDAVYSDALWRTDASGHLLINKIALLLNEALNLTLRIDDEVVQCGVFDHSVKSDLEVSSVTFSTDEGNSYRINSSGVELNIGVAGTSVEIEYGNMAEDAVIFSRFNVDGSKMSYGIAGNKSFSPIPGKEDILSAEEYLIWSESSVFNDKSNDVSLSGIIRYEIMPDREYGASALFSSFIEGMNRDYIIKDVSDAIGRIDWMDVFSKWFESSESLNLGDLQKGVINMSDIEIKNNEGTSPFVFTRLVEMKSDGKGGAVDYIDVEMEALKDFSSFFDEGADIVIQNGAKAGLRLKGTCSGLVQHPPYGSVVEFSLEGYEFYTLDGTSLPFISNEIKREMEFSSLEGVMKGTFLINPRNTDPITIEALMEIDDLQAPESAENLSIDKVVVSEINTGELAM